MSEPGVEAPSSLPDATHAAARPRVTGDGEKRRDAPFDSLPLEVGEVIRWEAWEPAFHRFSYYAIVVTDRAVHLFSTWLTSSARWRRVPLAEVLSAKFVSSWFMPKLVVRHCGGRAVLRTPPDCGEARRIDREQLAEAAAFIHAGIGANLRYIVVEPSVITNAGAEFARIAHWLLELDAQGHPLREVAIGHDGVPFSHAPTPADRGGWCDSPCSFQATEWEASTASAFEEAWSEAMQRPPSAS